MKLKLRARHYLKMVGYTDEEITLIENTEYRYMYDYRNKITEQLAIRRLGKESWLSGIARACFHESAARQCRLGSKIIYIERIK